MCTPKEHLDLMNSASYCPACGDSKSIEEDYCLDCYLQSEDIIILKADGWEPVPMYPYEVLPEYTVGYVSDVTTFTP